MSSDLAVGIDLGTTFSCVAVYRDGKAELIPNEEGNRTIPSIVYFDPRSGEVSIGRIADKLSLHCPGNCLFDAKRFIGRQYEDEFVSRYINSNHVHFSLVRAPDGQAAYEIEVSGQKYVKKPEEVSSEILKYLKTAASNYLGETVTKAVVSVPAYFNNAQRMATRRAAELAGFTVLKLVTEPTAAAVHYVSDRCRIRSNILSFDFGGGTLDASLIEVNKNIFEVKVVYGDTLLGGRNFDEVLFEYFYKDFRDLPGSSFATKVNKRRLHNACVELKEILSSKEEFDYCLGNDGNSDLSVFMTRKRLEEMSEHIFQRIIEVVEQCLKDSGITSSDIDEVVLVGGSTWIPKVREILRFYFGAEKIKTDLHPNEAVAAGASIQAAVLLGDCLDLEEYKVIEVTPMSLGTELDGNLMNIYIPRNTSLPAKVTKTQRTVHNNQKEIEIYVYEGERKNTKYNTRLGEFLITGLPEKRAGEVECVIEFSLDEDGILSVTATETSTGKNNRLVLTMGRFRLSKNKIVSTLKDVKKHTNEDKDLENFISYKVVVERHCKHVLYDLNKISSEEDRCFVKMCTQKFLKFSQNLDFKEVDTLEAIFVVYNSLILDILKKYRMLELYYK